MIIGSNMLATYFDTKDRSCHFWMSFFKGGVFGRGLRNSLWKIKLRKFFEFWKWGRVNAKEKLKGIDHLTWPSRDWLRNILECVFGQIVIQKHLRILHLKVSGLKQREFRVCWTEFWSGTFTFWVQPRSQKASVPSGNSSCFFLQKEFDSKLYKFSGPAMAVPFYFFILIPKGILMKGTNREFLFFTAVSLFEANWFATGNKCFWDRSFEMLKEKQQFKFKVVLNC